MGLWVGLDWKDFSKRKKAVGDVVVTGRSLEPTEGQASPPHRREGCCSLSPSLALQKPVVEGNGRQVPRSLEPKLRDPGGGAGGTELGAVCSLSPHPTMGHQRK